MSDPKEDLIDLRMAYDGAITRMLNMEAYQLPSDPRDRARVQVEYDIAKNATTAAHVAYLNALRSAGL